MKGHLFLLCLLASTTWAEPPSPGHGSIAKTVPRTWIQVPPSQYAPGFSYRVEAHGSKLQIICRMSETPKAASLGLHVWIADPDLVSLRAEQIKNCKAELQRAEDDLKDKGHQRPDCHEALASFIESAKVALTQLRDYDPFTQFLVRFPDSPLPHGNSISPELQTTNEGLSGEIDLDRQLNLRSKHILTKLSIGANLEPVNHYRKGPIQKPLLVKLAAPWTQPVDPNMALNLLAIAGSDVVLHPEGNGLGLMKRSIITETGCFGMDGTYEVHGDWEIFDPGILTPEGSLKTGEEPYIPIDGVTLRYFMGSLVIQYQGRSSAVPADISSLGEEGCKVWDVQTSHQGISLLYQISGLSRPRGGSGQCGAGTESDLIWVWLSTDLRIIKSRSLLIESCTQDIYADNGAPAGGWTFDRPHSGESVTVSFDKKFPFRGLKVRIQPLRN